MRLSTIKCNVFEGHVIINLETTTSNAHTVKKNCVRKLRENIFQFQFFLRQNSRTLKMIYFKRLLEFSAHLTAETEDKGKKLWQIHRVQFSYVGLGYYPCGGFPSKCPSWTQEPLADQDQTYNLYVITPSKPR